MLAALLIGLAIPLSVAASSFAPTTFRSFERMLLPQASVQGFRMDASHPGLAVVVSHACEVRELSPEKQEFLHSVGVTFGRPEVYALYKRELRVLEQGRERWIPFQEETLDHLLQNACEYHEIGITVRYLAVHSTLGRVYAGIGYCSTGCQRPEPVRCFVDELRGVRVGAPLEETRKRLTSQFGPEHVAPQAGEMRHWAYGVDREHETTLIIGDGGDGPRRKVFSVQISGPPNPDLDLVGGLQLGDPASEIYKVLGTPVSRKDSGDGFELLSFEGTPCSVELKNGVLASVKIVADPNYFEE